jgi:hypothetical protein
MGRKNKEKFDKDEIIEKPSLIVSMDYNCDFQDTEDAYEAYEENLDNQNDGILDSFFRIKEYEHDNLFGIFKNISFERYKNFLEKNLKI